MQTSLVCSPHSIHWAHQPGHFADLLKEFLGISGDPWFTLWEIWYFRFQPGGNPICLSKVIGLGIWGRGVSRVMTVNRESHCHSFLRPRGEQAWEQATQSRVHAKDNHRKQGPRPHGTHYVTEFFGCVLNTRQHPKMEPRMLSSTSPNQDLT